MTDPNSLGYEGQIYAKKTYCVTRTLSNTHTKGTIKMISDKTVITQFRPLSSTLFRLKPFHPSIHTATKYAKIVVMTTLVDLAALPAVLRLSDIDDVGKATVSVLPNQHRFN